jgi:SAM-dependent methyltransferase
MATQGENGVRNSLPLATFADLRKISPGRLMRAPSSASRRVRHRLEVAGGGLRSVSDIGMTPRLESFVSILGALPAGRLLDLGAGHGAFSRIASAMGWEVTAFDVRSVRFPSDARGIRWVTGDVLDLVVPPGDFDLVLCLGLLYHLELEDQITLLRKLSTTTLLLDTHASTELDPNLNPHANWLGEIVEVDGYQGRYYSEVRGVSDSDRKEVPTAAWNNARSFWATEESLVAMLHDCGFGTVMTDTFAHTYARSFQLCLPARSPGVAIDRGSPRRGPVREGRSLINGAVRRWNSNLRAGEPFA